MNHCRGAAICRAASELYLPPCTQQLVEEGGHGEASLFEQGCEPPYGELHAEACVAAARLSAGAIQWLDPP